MARSIRVIKKSRGRPKTTGTGTLIGLRLQREVLARLDAWIKDENDRPTRPEAIRRLVEQALDAQPKSRKAK